MIEVREARAAELEWIEEKTSCVLTRKATALVALHGDKKVGMVAYDLWTENAVWMHYAFASPAALRRMLRPMWDYVFRWAKKARAFGMIVADNQRSLRLAVGMGAREVARLKDGWAVGTDLVIVEMRKEDCRYE